MSGTEEQLNTSLQLSEEKVSKDDKSNPNEIIEIGVRCTIQNITEINTAAQTFTCRLKVKLIWFASDEDIESWENRDKNQNDWEPVSLKPTVLFTNALAPPEITIKDERDSFYEITKKLDKKTGRKLIGYDFGVNGTFMEQFELKSFPFDSQDMSIFMKLQNKGGSNFYRFVPDWSTNEFGKFQLSNSVTTEWTIHRPMLEFGWTDSRESKQGYVYPLFVAKFKMERNYQFYMSRVCAYLAMLSFLSLTAFSISIDSPGDRLGVNFTMLLAIIAYQLVVASLLPIVDFLTFIDKYSTCSTAYVSLITLENGIIGYLYNLDDSDTTLMKTIDDIFFFIFVALWVFGQLLFLQIAVSTKNKEMAKLTMGTSALMKLEDEDSSKNYYFYRKEIDESQYKQLNDLSWMSLMGERKE